MSVVPKKPIVQKAQRKLDHYLIHPDHSIESYDSIQPIDSIEPLVPFKRGRVFVASMNLRGKRAPLGSPSSLTLNVTSAQPHASKNRAAFSPMTLVPGGFNPTHPDSSHKFHCFENWWQSLKKIDGVDKNISDEWWLKQTAPHRRFPNSKDKKKLYCLLDGTQYNYVDSRKHIYVPFYRQYILSRTISTDALHFYKQKLDAGHDVTIFDFDGPRLTDGPDKGITCLELSHELLQQKIEDTSFPFGHCYVVAALLANIPF